MKPDNQTIRSFKDLRVWQESLALARMIYLCTARFPVEERFGLVTQMRRAAVSIPSNIAEGHSRSSSKEFLHFLSVAVGSMAELETQTILSSELGMLPDSERDEIGVALDSVGRMLRGLQKSIASYCLRECPESYRSELDRSLDLLNAADLASPEPLAPSPEDSISNHINHKE